MSWHNIKIDPADTAFSEWIRRRDGKCVKCGRYGTGPKGIFGLQASHFIKRRYESTRFDPLNVDALCATCHNYFETHQTEHEEWQVDTKGQKIVNALKIAAQAYTKKDRESQKIYWRGRLKKEYPVD